jgi:hypothetical protein
VLQRGDVDCGADAVAASARVVAAGRWWAGKPLVRAHVRVVAGCHDAASQRALAAWLACFGSRSVSVPLACVQLRGVGMAWLVRCASAEPAVRHPFPPATA